jgi:phage-related protein
VKPVRWIGGSLEDLRAFPAAARHTIGLALLDAQMGRKHPAAKPLRGFGGAGVLEIVEDYGGDAYRAVYTVRWAGAIYVLHTFKKKAKRGIQTPKQDLELIKARLKRAEEDYRQWQRTEGK